MTTQCPECGKQIELDPRASVEPLCPECGYNFDYPPYLAPEEPDPIRCPKCGSQTWECWNEITEWFVTEDGEEYEMPVGYLRCRNCDARWTHTDSTDRWIGK